MKQINIFILATVLSFSVKAQNNPQPCTAPEASQFDFWTGTWDAFTADTLTATNTIQKIMGGCTLQENFENPKISYSGKSWSVYSPQRKLWQQTWVDNQGAFIHLTGEFKDGKMTLSTQPRKMPDGKQIVSRMVYYNIMPASFDWVWEATTDGGSTWQPNWKIHYLRKK
ncbi:MAG: hypothetical protein ABIO04_12100 [Ferruginibacter sp.]